MALDSNVLVYALGVGREGDEPKFAVARRVIAAVPPGRLVLPAQVLGEVCHVLRRKGRRDAAAAAGVVGAWRERADAVAATTSAVLADALDLAAEHGLQVWDAVILAASAEAGCAFLLSEDLQAGFAHRGCEVANPFAPTLPPRLARLLS